MGLLVPEDGSISLLSQSGFDGYISVAICEPNRAIYKWNEIKEHVLFQESESLRDLLEKPVPTVHFPYATRHFMFSKVLDLRQREARGWLVEIYGGDILRFFNCPIPTWFSEIVDFLIDPYIGGNPFTFFISTKLIDHGVEALIYPSARSDFVAIVNDGDLCDFSGWNLIDLRPPLFETSDDDLSALPESLHVLIDSELDIGMMTSLGLISDDDNRERRPGRGDPVCFQEAEDGPYCGSLRCVGLEESREKEYFRSMVNGRSPWFELRTENVLQRKFGESALVKIEDFFDIIYETSSLVNPRHIMRAVE